MRTQHLMPSWIHFVETFRYIFTFTTIILKASLTELKKYGYILKKPSMSLEKRVMICNILNMSQSFATNIETR